MMRLTLVMILTLLLVSFSLSQSLRKTKTTKSEEEDSGSLSFISRQDFTAIMGEFGLPVCESMIRSYLKTRLVQVHPSRNLLPLAN